MPLRLTPELDAPAVRALAAAVAAHDGVDAWSEQTLLHLASPADGPTPWAHLSAWDGTDLVGYAHVDAADTAAAAVEIAVSPSARRRGIGSALWREVTRQWPAGRWWAHGNLPPAVAFAAAHALHPVRELWQMARDVVPAAPPTTVTVPAGFEVRALRPGTDDEAAWVALNARAFASHPEQGRVDLDDLHRRMAAPWFDPGGFLLLWDHRRRADASGDGRLAAYHWTKIEDGTGEVYVVGVDPDLHGTGLGTVVTALGIAHLEARGVPSITLYVDGDNTAAIATYRRAGFTRSALDVQYATSLSASPTG